MFSLWQPVVQWEFRSVNSISGKPEYYQNRTWHTVNFMTEKVVPKGELMLHYTQKTVVTRNIF
ncbi:MAG: hypothetical protein ACLTZT_19665 [Butyricimonas faecalis]